MANSDHPQSPQQEVGWRPVPDPTLLTTQQLLREISSLRAELISHSDFNREIVETRINHNGAQVIQIRDNLHTQIDRAIAAFRDQIEARLLSVDSSITSIQKAVDVAFLAAKEATSKIESSFTKSIDSQQALLNATSRATDDKVGDLKDRLTTIESRTAGMTSANTENRVVNTDSSARMMAIVGIVIAAVVGAGEILARLAH